MGKILKLYIAPKGTSGVREAKESIYLKENFGIEGDKFAGGEIERSLMIIGKNSYELAEKHGIKLPEVALGENILVDFDPHFLAFGAKLKIGEAILEVTKKCSLCKHLSKYNSKLPKLMLHKRGIYCKILKSGKINVGDKVDIIEITKEIA